MTTATTASSTARVWPQAGRPATQVVPWPPPCSPAAVSTCGARSGNTASIGITARSWKSRTANELCPALVLSRPFSARLCSTRAVEDRLRVIPTASATRQLSPRARAPPVKAHAGQEHLETAEAEDLPAQAQQQRGLELEAHQEEHHHHAELGEVHDVLPSSPTRPRTKGPIIAPAIR